MKVVLGLSGLLFLAGIFWQPCVHADDKQEAFIIAVIEDDLVRAKAMLASGADVNAVHDGFSPIYGAGSVAMMELLIEAGADVNVRDKKSGRTPLHVAAQRGLRYRGDSNTALVLIEAGADVNAQDKYGATPLHAAALSCNANLAEAFIGAGAEVNAKARLYPGEDPLTPLDCASPCGMFDDGKTEEVLLANGGDGDLYREMAERERELEQRERDDGTLLHSAVMGGTLADVAKLIDEGADVNTVDSAGYTPLHRATQEAADGTRNDGAKKAKLLIEAGADIEATDALGWQAIHSAAFGDSDEAVEVLQVLIEAGADINAKLTMMSGNVTTPLGLAEHYKIKEFLLANGAQ